jgi:hypothetical protein
MTMRNRLSIQSLAVAAVSVAQVADAHPGHGLLDGRFGFLHYLVGHTGGILPVVAVLGAGALAWLWNRRPVPKQAPARARKPEQTQRRDGERR